METLVRNAVIEIRRFTAVGQWFHISTELNPADLGTRPATVEEIMLDSEWQLGKEWMGMNYEDMPLKTIEDINLTSEAKRQASQEEKHADLFGVNLPELRHRVAERYDQFHYLYDPNRYGWIRATRVMGYVIKFIKVKLPNYEPCWKPPLPLAEAEQPELERLQKYGEYYYYFKCTQEVKLFSNPKDYKNSYVEKGSIYFYTGRILQGQGVDTPVDNFFDVQPLDFVRPLMDRWSPVAYSIMVHVHTSISHHRNANVTLRESRTIAYVLRGRDLAIEISENCRFCTRFKAKTLEVEMGNLHQSRLTIAPPFYHVQIDLFGPVTMVCEHNHRSTIKSYGAVYKDPASTSIAAFAMPGYSTAAFLTTYTRFASRYGHPTKVLIDEGSQLLSACRNMEISIQDIKNHVNSTLQIGVDFETAPVQGHNVTGMVERSIKEVKGLLEKLFGGRKLDLLTFETCLAFVCNELNNFPICIGSKTEHLGNVDIITPNRLLLGRNNRRSLGGFAKVETPSRMLDQQQDLYKLWWDLWNQELLTYFVPRPQHWPVNNDLLKVGDIVLFLKADAQQSFGHPVYRIARVRELETSTDGRERVAILEYRIPEENGLKTTRRAIRKMVKIHSEEELDIVQELNRAAKAVDTGYHLRLARCAQDPNVIWVPTGDIHVPGDNDLGDNEAPYSDSVGSENVQDLLPGDGLQG